MIRDPNITAPSITTIGNTVGDVAFDVAVVDATNEDDEDRDVIVGEDILPPYQPLPPPNYNFDARSRVRVILAAVGLAVKGAKT